MTARVGLVARSEDRGIGLQTFEMFRHLTPAKTLVVTGIPSGFPEHLERYPGATVIELVDDQFDEATIRSWLEGLDVVITVETFYDWRLVEWADSMGVKTIVHGNPEFYRHASGKLPHPSAWWWSTTWRLAELPAGDVVPVPVPDEADGVAASPGGQLTVLHVVGRKAHADRNGSEVFMTALRFVRQPMHVRVFCQDKAPMPPRSVSPRVTIDYVTHSIDDRWRMYDGVDVLVLPRRFGGLCLPALEALGAGKAVVMPNVSPNYRWPIIPVEYTPGSTNVPCGRIDMANVKPQALAVLLDELATNSGRVVDAQRAAREWSSVNRWSNLRQRYVDGFERVAALA